MTPVRADLPVNRIAAILARVSSRPETLREGAWVLGHKLVEFLLVFVGLKLFTNLMSPKSYGEFNLALTAVGLLADTTVMPIAHAYYRSISQAKAIGAERAVGVSMLKWYAASTLVVATAVGAFTVPLSGWLQIGRWTALATGCLFLANRWRALAVEVSDMQRDRRNAAFHNLGFIALQTLLVAFAAYWWQDEPALALLGYAGAAAAFFAIGTIPIIHSILARPIGSAGTLGPMILSFGLPYGALLACQWVQNFSERYVLGIRMDLESVGTYVAAYQVCGIPFMLLSTVLNGFCVPIAYQRAGDLRRADQAWQANRVLLAGAGLYCGLGLLIVPLYALWGEFAVRTLTNADFVLPATVLACIAASRFLQCLGLMMQPFFAVHQEMGSSLVFRLIGGLLVAPVCWWTVGRWGIAGAAGGVLASGTIYTLLVIVGPGGCWSLVQRGWPNRAAGAGKSR
jgi:O-antigen/teichoic acid export membrane protein